MNQSDINTSHNQKSVSADEELKLIQAVKQGNSTAYSKLINLNQGYIISIARQYYSKEVSSKGLTIEDLIQEGNIGLMEAIEKFDETKGVKFITYAAHWIKASILKAIGEEMKIKTSSYEESESKANKDGSNDDEGTETSDNEDISIEKDGVLNDDATTIQNISANDNGDAENESFNNETSINKSRSEDIEGALFSILDERECKIIKMFFGIDSPMMGLKEIGEELNLSSERVRQLKERALKRIKKRDKSGLFEKYYSSKVDKE